MNTKIVQENAVRML